MVFLGAPGARVYIKTVVLDWKKFGETRGWKCIYGTTILADLFCTWHSNFLILTIPHKLKINPVLCMKNWCCKTFPNSPKDRQLTLLKARSEPLACLKGHAISWMPAHHQFSFLFYFS
jgi:hypothetical protein